MIRSLYSGVSGLKANQKKMDVTGNNIANSTTTAFKAGRVRFKDMFSETIAEAQIGKNPKQIGLGVEVAGIDNDMSNGALQPTGRELDFALEGEGFFMLRNDAGEDVFTRDGAFTLDNEGNLVNSSGLNVRGIMYDADEVDSNDGNKFSYDDQETDYTGEIKDIQIYRKLDLGGTDKHDLKSYSIDSKGNINAKYVNATDGDEQDVFLGKVLLAKFTNKEGLKKLGGNVYQRTPNSDLPGANFKEDIVGEATKDGYGIIRNGVLEMSNVDLANEFTDMITTSRAYQANSRTITTSDEMLQELINLKR